MKLQERITQIKDSMLQNIIGLCVTPKSEGELTKIVTSFREGDSGAVAASVSSMAATNYVVNYVFHLLKKALEEDSCEYYRDQNSVADIVAIIAMDYAAGGHKFLKEYQDQYGIAQTREFIHTLAERIEDITHELDWGHWDGGFDVDLVEPLLKRIDLRLHTDPDTFTGPHDLPPVEWFEETIYELFGKNKVIYD